MFNIAAALFIDLDICVVVVYRPPPNTALHYKDYLLSLLSDFCIDKEVIWLRNFNLPSLDWGCENVTHGYAQCVSGLQVRRVI